MRAGLIFGGVIIKQIKIFYFFIIIICLLTLSVSAVDYDDDISLDILSKSLSIDDYNNQYNLNVTGKILLFFDGNYYVFYYNNTYTCYSLKPTNDNIIYYYNKNINDNSVGYYNKTHNSGDCYKLFVSLPLLINNFKYCTSNCYVFYSDNLYDSFTFEKNYPIVTTNEEIWQNRPSYVKAQDDASATYSFDTAFMLQNIDGIYLYYFNQNDNTYKTRLDDVDYTDVSNSTLQLQSCGTNDTNRCICYHYNSDTNVYEPVGINVTPVYYVIPNSS